ncbi:MAG TPA: aminoacyl-tRNA hydrolase [Patescibacteria group bacterium]|nr:aminoacyl-tRNA hydrolase [Patescibacteria group bacterium]
MKLIVGLGNPGEKYEKTRHNLGFMVIDSFLKDFESAKDGQWEDSAKFKSDILQIEYKPKVGELVKVILAKPKTYMNNSGMATVLISSFYKIKPEDIWIVNDDFDLPLGSMKIRFGGASAGHHGVESIISALNTDKFWRFRMGTGESHAKGKMAKHKIREAEDFVLGGFAKGEAGKIRELIKRGSKAISMALEEGLLKSQNRFNTK